MKFLGHIIGHGKVRSDPAKIEVIKNWPLPTSLKLLQGFLGLVNFFRDHVDHLSCIAAPLTNMTSDTVASTYNWGSWRPSDLQAFKDTKLALAEAAELYVPDLTKQFTVYSDASDVGCGGTLLQDNKPVAFYSHKFSGDKDKPASRIVHDMIAKAVSEATATAFASSSGNSSIAKALNKPLTWSNDANGTRRADIWLQQIKSYADAHGVEPQSIIESYLGPAIGNLYNDRVQAWAKQYKQPTWLEVCTAFKDMVGQRTDHEQVKVVDDLVQLRVKQLSNQSLFTFKVKLQHKIMVSGLVGDELAVNWFITGLGSNPLRADCQPALTNGRLKTLDDAYEHAIGLERMLEAKGTKPFGSDPHVQAQTANPPKPATGHLNAMVRQGANGKPATNAQGGWTCYDCGGVRKEPADWCKNFDFHKFCLAEFADGIGDAYKRYGGGGGGGGYNRRRGGGGGYHGGNNRSGGGGGGHNGPKGVKKHKGHNQQRSNRPAS